MTIEAQTKKHIYTVTELTRNIKIVIEDTFPGVWVEGEVSNFVKHSSGHMYFSLKDTDSVLNCVFFRGANRFMKFKVENGLQVISSGKISIYNKRGQYQLYVEKMEPKGLGALQLAFEQLKEKLKREGLFDGIRKKEIPYLPRRIGVVTSPTGAAIRDILRVTRERFGNADLIINPVCVQGKGAGEEIAKAIEVFNRRKDADVLIVGRGGGSLEDLWAFNEERVARAIYNSDIPIISAVGHETDWTIADFVADRRASTPSAAAQMAIPRKEELIERIEVARARMKSALLSIISERSEWLTRLAGNRVFKDPFSMIDQHRQTVDDLIKDLKLYTGHKMEISAAALKNLTGKMAGLSPFAVLERGYSVTTALDTECVIKDIKSIKKGERIKTRLHRGGFISVVERIEVRGDGRGKI